MKHLLTLFLLGGLLASQAAFAQEWVNGYTRSNGTTVGGYYRSTPDGDASNNYSTRGNINPYTGKEGTVEPSTTYTSPSNSYGTYGNSNQGSSSFGRIGW